MLSLFVIVLVALLMGFRSSAGIIEWLGVAGMLALFTLTLTWIAAIAGLSAKSVDGAAAIAYPIHLLPLISSAFVPTATMPPAVRVFAENQPVTPVVETIRALLSNQPVGNELWLALSWCGGIVFLAYILAMRVYRRAR
jgi:ABC-2 type transport system permease protein